jgi:hypothetical protein
VFITWSTSLGEKTMYTWKDLVKGTITFLAMMSILSGFMILNGLHYAGAL